VSASSMNHESLPMQRLQSYYSSYYSSCAHQGAISRVKQWGKGLLGFHGERGSTSVYGGLMPPALPPVGSRGKAPAGQGVWGRSPPEADDILALWKYICELFLIPFT